MLVIAALVIASGFALREAWEQLAHPTTPALPSGTLGNLGTRVEGKR
jgi:hypothetical protein